MAKFSPWAATLNELRRLGGLEHAPNTWCQRTPTEPNALTDGSIKLIILDSPRNSILARKTT